MTIEEKKASIMAEVQNNEAVFKLIRAAICKALHDMDETQVDSLMLLLELPVE